MATPLPVKRMTKERQELEKENSDYFVHFKDDNLLEFDAYIIGPDDSLYQHKLIKLRLKIPDRYPMVSAPLDVRPPFLAWDSDEIIQGTADCHVRTTFRAENSPKPLRRGQSLSQHTWNMGW